MEVDEVYKEQVTCRVCGNERFVPIVDLGTQVLSGIFPEDSAVVIPATPLEVIKCDDTQNNNACGLVQLKHSANVEQMYGTTYGYYSSLSSSMVQHLTGILELLGGIRPLIPGDNVLDIGCNDGTLLNLITTPDVNRVGIDPSSAKFIDKFDPKIRLICDFFSDNAVREIAGDDKFSQITAIAMFYDLDHPLEFFQGIQRLLSPDGLWAIELAYLPAMLENLIYDQICHEHVTYPSFRQIEWLSGRAGLRVVDVRFNNVNGGSFLVIGCRSDNRAYQLCGSIAETQEKEKLLLEAKPFKRFRQRIKRHREDVRTFLESAKLDGKTVMGYGASTKGNIVLNYCDIGPTLLEAICDSNPEKWGRVTPGSKIPIIPKEEMRMRDPDILFVLIWHFHKEILIDEEDFIMKGGSIVFDLPKIHIVNKSNYEEHLVNGFSKYSFELT